MDRNKIRRWAVPGGLAALLVLLAACGPEVSDESCEAKKGGGAEHTYTLKNTEDEKVTFQWIVKDDPDDDHFNRKGEEISLGGGDTTTRTVTVGKNDDGKRVQIFWPGPKGDDTTKFNKVAKSSC